MLEAIYTSLSGMTAYRNGLDVISNNVANMNTPGFKLSDPLFRDLVRRNGNAVSNAGEQPQSTGAGVRSGDAELSFQQGELRDTGNSLDAAIDGSGFFTLEQDGARVYTRAGQFEFNPDGILVERGSGATVLVNTDSTSFTAFDSSSERSFPPRVTGEVKLSGILARASTGSTFEIPKVTVFDASGATVDVKIRFVRDSADAQHWTMEVVGKDNATLGSGAIRFNADGTPATDASSLKVTLTGADAKTFDVTFNLGEPGTFGGVTSVAGTTISQVQLLKQDGVALGVLSAVEFTETGRIKLSYSNGETKEVATLVLARFDTPNQLRSLGGSHYAGNGVDEPVYSAALSSGLGRIVGGQIELSNVDLTGQFTDLIIVQRGYQASSQITSVANEMIQQLLAMSSGR